MPIEAFEREFLKNTYGRVREVRATRRRLSWDAYFMNLALSAASRTTCDRGAQGCAIAKDNHILATGFGGSPPGFPHCDDDGHNLHKVTHRDGHSSEHCVNTIHAEDNAIIQVGVQGGGLKGSTLYCTMTPCFRCAMKIVRAGIVRVVCMFRYQEAEAGEKILEEGGVAFEYIQRDVQSYD